MPSDQRMDVVAEYRPAVVALVARLMRRRPSDPDVEDVAHETFRRVLEHPDRWDEGRPLLPWVLGIARHVALDALRTSARQRARTSSPRSDDTTDDPTLRIFDAGPGPERSYAAREMARLLERAVAALPERERSALLLFHLEGLSYKDIAERLGVPPATVGTWVLRARQSISGALGEAATPKQRGES